MPQISLTDKPQRLKDAARGVVAAAVRPLWGSLPRALYHGKWPNTVMLALTRVCNVDCVFCPYRYVDRSAKVHMPDDLFEKVLHDLEEAKVRRVMLSPNVGEPLLAPRFLEKVMRLREHGVRFVELTTNASCLHKVGVDAILSEGPDQINLSFPGFDKEMYERDLHVRFYDQTRANVLELLRRNHALGRPRVVNLLLRGDTGLDRLLAAPEMEEAKRLATSVSFMTEVDDWLGLIKPDDLPEGYRIQAHRPPLLARPCALLFDLTLHPDGDIQLCSCRNIFADPGLKIGDLREMSILEAYARIPLVFDTWEQGKYPSCCKTCSMYSDPAVLFAARALREVRKTLWGP